MSVLARIRLVALAVVAALLLATPAAFGQADIREQIYGECERGPISGTYMTAQLEDARANLPADLRDYTDCLDAIDRALAASRDKDDRNRPGGGGGASSGGSTSAGGGGGAPASGAGGSSGSSTGATGAAGSFTSPSPSRPPTANAPAAVRRLFIAPFPTVRIAGRLTATGARLRVVSVTAPRDSRIDARCLRGSCRGRRVQRRVGRSRIVRLRPFERSLRAGTVITIAVSARGKIGKHMRLTVRRGAAPSRQDRCLAVNSRRAITCPRA